MATVEIKGLDGYEDLLKRLDANVDAVIGSGIYKGAEVVADTVRDKINGLRVDGPSDEETRRRWKQKAGLLDSLGISAMRNDKGFLNVKIGFDGYNSVKTKVHPKGQPNVMVARIFESGTSFSSKQPFIKQALRESKERARQAMLEEVDKKIEEIKGGR